MTASKFSPVPDKEAFYARVWDLVREVPEGMVVTYGQVAELVEPPQGMLSRQYLAFGPRWVGSAMAHCPADVPWHRVVNAQGKISRRASGSHLRQQERLEAAKDELRTLFGKPRRSTSVRSREVAPERNGQGDRHHWGSWRPRSGNVIGPLECR